MARGDPGAEQFANLIVSCRNRHIAAGISPVMDMREELTTNEDIKVRNGIDTPTQVHFMQHLVRCDEVRRFITHNPDAKNLGDKIAKAIDADAEIEQAENPMGGGSTRCALGRERDAGSSALPHPAPRVAHPSTTTARWII